MGVEKATVSSGCFKQREFVEKVTEVKLFATQAQGLHFFCYRGAGVEKADVSNLDFERLGGPKQDQGGSRDPGGSKKQGSGHEGKTSTNEPGDFL